MTKRKVSTKRRGTKDQPVDAEIKRAAKRAGIDPATGLAPEEAAAVDRLEKMGLPVSAYGLAIVKGLRKRGATSDEVVRTLRREAAELQSAAEQITPEPETRDAMLRDALDVIEAARAIFEHQGNDADLLGEALRSAQDDLELFEQASSSAPAEMAYLRAQYRIELALKLDAFRKKHPTWKPAKALADEPEAERAAEVAS